MTGICKNRWFFVMEGRVRLNWPVLSTKKRFYGNTSLHLISIIAFYCMV